MLKLVRPVSGTSILPYVLRSESCGKALDGFLASGRDTPLDAHEPALSNLSHGVLQTLLFLGAGSISWKARLPGVVQSLLSNQMNIQTDEGGTKSKRNAGGLTLRDLGPCVGHDMMSRIVFGVRENDG